MFNKIKTNTEAAPRTGLSNKCLKSLSIQRNFSMKISNNQQKVDKNDGLWI